MIAELIKRVCVWGGEELKMHNVINTREIFPLGGVAIARKLRGVD